MNILFYCGLIMVFLCLPLTGRSQTYHPVTHRSGTQSVNGINVTVTPTGAGAHTHPNWCGAGPYWIGAGSGPPGINIPGSYSFSFGTAVGNVRIRLTAIETGEVITFVVNGVPYMLSGTNLSIFLGTCNQVQATTAGGNLIGTTTISPASGTEVNIGGGINSITVATTGWINGTVFSLSFGGIYVYSNAPLCSGDTLKLFVSPDPDTAGTTYSWTGPSGFNSNLQNPVIPEVAMAQEGMYRVTVATAVDTFKDSTYVTVMSTPVTAIVIDTPVCAGKVLELSDTTTLSDIGYQWEGPNGFNASMTRPVIPNVQSIHSGTYTLTITLGECSYQTTATIRVLQHSHHGFTEIICSNESFDFNGRRLKEPGTYRDSLVAANGCDSTITLNLVVLPAPEISISVDQGAMPLCRSDTVLCEAAGARSYYWFSNDQLVGSSNREYIHLPHLSNKVLVAGRADNGCRDTAEAIINVNACCALFIPNAFSPNGDGINDNFAPVPHGHILKYRIQLFNRWGQLVFSAFDINKFWDGTYNGVAVTMGTYFYYIMAECLDGKELIHKGDVLLIR